MLGSQGPPQLLTCSLCPPSVWKSRNGTANESRQRQGDCLTVTVQGKTGIVWEIKLKTHEEITFTAPFPRLSPVPDFSLQALLQAARRPLSTAGGPGSGLWFLPASPLFSLFSSALSWVLHSLRCLQESSAPERAIHRLWWRSAPPWSASSTTSSSSNPSVPHAVSGSFFFLLSLGCSSVLSSVFPVVP